MADSNTVRILELDGGGARGLISATFLDLFVTKWGINPNELWKYFDVICGTSIGGMQAIAYANGLAPSDMKEMFLTDAPWIFTTSTSTPSIEPSVLSKVITMVGSGTFYSGETEGIGTMRLQSKLQEILGTKTLQDLKTNVVITSFEKNDAEPDFSSTTNTPVYFSNISSNLIPILKGQSFSAVDVCMATSAAPIYFPSWTIGEDTYIDGGITHNNPSSFGLAIAKALKPTANRACVLSIGTGLGDVGFPPSPPSALFHAELSHLRANSAAYAAAYNVPSDHMDAILNLDSMTLNNNNGLTLLEGAYLWMYIFGAAMAGPQEVVHQELNIRSRYTLENTKYYRFQGYLDPDYDTDLDTTDPDTLQYYQDFATTTFNNDLSRITTFIGHLTA